jgi:hypothetical protein
MDEGLKFVRKSICRKRLFSCQRAPGYSNGTRNRSSSIMPDNTGRSVLALNAPSGTRACSASDLVASLRTSGHSCSSDALRTRFLQRAAREQKGSAPSITANPGKGAGQRPATSRAPRRMAAVTQSVHIDRVRQLRDSVLEPRRSNKCGEITEPGFNLIRVPDANVVRVKTTPSGSEANGGGQPVSARLITHGVRPPEPLAYFTGVHVARLLCDLRVRHRSRRSACWREGFTVRLMRSPTARIDRSDAETDVITTSASRRPQ